MTIDVLVERTPAPFDQNDECFEIDFLEGVD